MKDFEEWMDLQAENPRHEKYYYRDMKAAYLAATERAAGIYEACHSCYCANIDPEGTPCYHCRTLQKIREG